MISFAPLLYRNVYAEDGGPIARTDTASFPIFEQHSFQSCAFLRPGLGGKKAPELYGAADGTGSAPTPALAEHIAISEAIERWAYYETLRNGDRSRYGFLVDKSSNGMSAFPGFAWQARRRARFEALERFALIGWWDRRLSATIHRAPYPDVGLIRIEHGQDSGEVVILYHKAPTGFVAYGHAAGSSLGSATTRAAIELARCEMVIARYRAVGGLLPLRDYFERRCLYFSTPEGHAEFLERLKSDTSRPAPSWRTVFDGPIQGPWSKWATVWRHCVEMPSLDFLNPQLNYFFW